MRKFQPSTLCENSNQVHYAKIPTKYIMRKFQPSTLCENSNQVHYAYLIISDLDQFQIKSEYSKTINKNGNTNLKLK